MKHNVDERKLWKYLKNLIIIILSGLLKDEYFIG